MISTDEQDEIARGAINRLDCVQKTVSAVIAKLATVEGGPVAVVNHTVGYNEIAAGEMGVGSTAGFSTYTNWEVDWKAAPKDKEHLYTAEQVAAKVAKYEAALKLALDCIVASTEYKCGNPAFEQCECAIKELK